MKKFFFHLYILAFCFNYGFALNSDSELAVIERLSHQVINFVKIDPHVYRSGSLTALRDVELLSELGIQTVISFQEIGEPDGALYYDARAEARKLQAQGIKFYHFPISYVENPLTSTTEFLVLIEAIKRGIVSSPVLVHCLAGRDRAGYFAALYRVLVQDWNVSEAISEMVLFNTANQNRDALEAYRRALEILEIAHKTGAEVQTYKISGPEEVNGVIRVFDIGSYWQRSRRSLLVLNQHDFSLLSRETIPKLDLSRALRREIARSGVLRIQQGMVKDGVEGGSKREKIHDLVRQVKFSRFHR